MSLDVYIEGQSRAWRFNQIETSRSEPWVDVFSRRPRFRETSQLSLWAIAVFNAETSRERVFFEPDRNGAPVAREMQQRSYSRAPWLFVTLSGSF